MAALGESGFIKYLKTQPVAGLYLLYGADAYLVEHYAAKLLKKALPDALRDFNFHQFGASSPPSLQTLYDSVEALPVMAGRQCVLVRDYPVAGLSSGDFDQLLALLSDLPETTTVLLLFTSADFGNPKAAKHKKLIELASKTGVCVNFAKKTRTDLLRFIADRAKKQGVSIEPAQCSHLADRCGDDLGVLANEVDKLCAYKQQGAITHADIDLLATEHIEASVFDLSKRIISGDYAGAYSKLDELFYMREEPTAILAVLSMSFIDLYRAKTAQIARIPAEETVKAFDYRGKSFRLDKARRDAPRFSVALLRDYLDILLDTDVKLKSARTDARVLLETAIARMLVRRAKEEGRH